MPKFIARAGDLEGQLIALYKEGVDLHKQRDQQTCTFYKTYTQAVWHYLDANTNMARAMQPDGSYSQPEVEAIYEPLLFFIARAQQYVLDAASRAEAMRLWFDWLAGAIKEADWLELRSFEQGLVDTHTMKCMCVCGARQWACGGVRV